MKYEYEWFSYENILKRTQREMQRRALMYDVTRFNDWDQMINCRCSDWEGHFLRGWKEKQHILCHVDVTVLILHLSFQQFGYHIVRIQFVCWFHFENGLADAKLWFHVQFWYHFEWSDLIERWSNKQVRSGCNTQHDKTDRQSMQNF